ncbi:MAG TPA: hypothetical protein DCE18_21095, partial [Syntrophobacteraceae bacterium]|nr:hypothetical protein [Syntrophobacteraceae bacterium]
LAEAGRGGVWPTRDDLKVLIAICQDPRGPMRETALTLLLSPPLANASGYLPWLLEQLPGIFPKPRQMPTELLEQVLEVVGFLGSVPRALEAGQFWSKCARKLPPTALRWLFGRTLPLRPLVGALWTPAMNRWFALKRHKGPTGRQWQLFERRLRKVVVGESWATLTTMDFGKLFRKGLPSPKALAGRSRYRRIAAALVAAPALQPILRGPTFPRPSPSQYWNACGPPTLKYMQALFHRQGEELLRVRDLSQRLSARTGRVVLSCHNATLAAASGWGVPMIHENFGTLEDWYRFQSAVSRSLRENCGHSLELHQRMEQIWGLYASRLIQPQIQQACWESQLRAQLGNSASGPDGAADLERLQAWEDSSSLEEMQPVAGQGWTGAVSPHQRIHPTAVAVWQEARRASWGSGLNLLAEIILEGQRWLDAGELRQLVIPWIDKFFISSRRDRDRDFFPLILECLEHQGCNPLVVFWEDTSHATFPSLKLALRQWREAGLACQGIGVFSDAAPPVGRQYAEDFIVAQHLDTRCFALRPYSDSFQPRSLEQLLERLDYPFLNPAIYDSSWKDNLVFIYAGTQVAPLVSVQCDAELFPAWLVADGRKWPFGAYMRGVLRRMVLGHDEYLLAREGLARFCAEWANLL